MSKVRGRNFRGSSFSNSLFQLGLACWWTGSTIDLRICRDWCRKSRNNRRLKYMCVCFLGMWNDAACNFHYHLWGGSSLLAPQKTWYVVVRNAPTPVGLKTCITHLKTNLFYRRGIECKLSYFEALCKSNHIILTCFIFFWSGHFLLPS